MDVRGELIRLSLWWAQIAHLELLVGVLRDHLVLAHPGDILDDNVEHVLSEELGIVGCITFVDSVVYFWHWFVEGFE